MSENMLQLQSLQPILFIKHFSEKPTACHILATHPCYPPVAPTQSSRQCLLAVHVPQTPESCKTFNIIWCESGKCHHHGLRSMRCCSPLVTCAYHTTHYSGGKTAARLAAKLCLHTEIPHPVAHVDVTPGRLKASSGGAPQARALASL